MLRLAAHTIQTQPAISEKLGVSGLQGVLALASILKQKNSDQVFDKVLDNSLAAGAAHFKLDTVTERVDRLNAGGRIYNYTAGGKENWLKGTKLTKTPNLYLYIVI